MTIDCPMNGAIFQTYVEQFVIRELSPGDVVVMDNLSSHKSDTAGSVLNFVYLR